MVVAKEMDGLVVIPGDDIHISLGPEYVVAMFSQPLAKFLVQDSGKTPTPSSFFSRTVDNSAGGSRERPEEVLRLAGVDFCIEDVASLGQSASQEALDVPSDLLVTCVMYCLMARQFMVGIMPSLTLSCCSSSEREGAFCQAWDSLCSSHQTCQWPNLSDQLNAESSRGL